MLPLVSRRKIAEVPVPEGRIIADELAGIELRLAAHAAVLPLSAGKEGRGGMQVAADGSRSDGPSSFFLLQGAGSTGVICSARIFQPASRLTTISLIRTRTTPGSTSGSPGGRPA